MGLPEYLSGGRIQGRSDDSSGAINGLGTAANGTNDGATRVTTPASAIWTVDQGDVSGISNNRMNITAIQNGTRAGFQHVLAANASADWTLRWKQNWSTITQQGADNNFKIGLTSDATVGYDGDEPNRVNVSLMIASGKRKWLLQKVGGSGQDSHDFDGENVFNTGVDYYMELTKDGSEATFSIKTGGYGGAGTEIANGGFSITGVSVSNQNQIFLHNQDSTVSNHAVNISTITEMFWYDDWDGSGSVPTPTTTFDFASSNLGSYSWNFDGSNDEVTTGLTQNLGNTFSVSTWVSCDEIVAWESFMGKGTNDNDEEFIAYLHSNGNDNALGGEFLGAKDFDSNVTPVKGRWFHVVYAIDGENGNSKIYVNGVLKDTDSTTGSNPDATPAFLLGNSRQDNFFDGRLSQTLVYNYTLTQSEVTTLYGSGLGVASPSLTGLLAWWDFQQASSGALTNLSIPTDASKDSITNVPAGTRYEETDTRKIFRRTVPVVGDETTVSSLTDVVFDDATKIGTVTYSGNEITLSGSTSHVDSINANLQFQNSGTQIVECDAENTGTSAWITFGLASAKVTDSGSDHGAQLEYGIRKADDGRTFIMTSSGTFGSSLGNFHDNSKLRITNNRTTVTYEISENGGSWSSLGSTTHGTPNATYYLQATVSQTGTAGSYTFDYTGDVIITTGTNAWVEKGTA